MESQKEFAFYFADQECATGYQALVNQWLSAIQDQVNAWVKLWYGKTHWSPGKLYEGPKLYVADENGECVVFDSRSGYLVKRRLNATRAQFLKALAKPKTIAWLAEEFGPPNGFDAMREIAELDAHDLLFQEGDHYLSSFTKANRSRASNGSPGSR